jgi:hypothetical protein
MLEFRLIELLAYYSCPFIDTRLHCLDDRKCLLNVFLYLYAFRRGVGGAHIMTGTGPI